MSAEAPFITAIVIVPLLVRAEHELLRVERMHVGGIEHRAGIQFTLDVLGVIVATNDRYPHLEEIVLILIIAEAVTAVVDVVGIKRIQRIGFVDFIGLTFVYSVLLLKHKTITERILGHFSATHTKLLFFSE